MMFYLDKLWYGAIVYIQMKGFVAFSSDNWHQSMMMMIVHKTF